MPSFPSALAGVLPGLGSAPLRARRLAAVSVAVAADAAYRREELYRGLDHGLRGGTITWHGARASLNRVRWTDDTTATGSLRVSGESLTGRLVLSGPGGPAARVSLRWGNAGPAVATVNGSQVRVARP